MTDDVKSSLAQITLRWMVQEIMSSKCGIVFDQNQLARWSIPVAAFAPAPVAETSRQPVVNQDAIQPLHDELKRQPLWWLLEIIPLHYTWQDAQNVWHRNYT